MILQKHKKRSTWANKFCHVFIDVRIRKKQERLRSPIPWNYTLRQSDEIKALKHWRRGGPLKRFGYYQRQKSQLYLTQIILGFKGKEEKLAFFSLSWLTWKKIVRGGRIQCSVATGKVFTWNGHTKIYFFASLRHREATSVCFLERQTMLIWMFLVFMPWPPEFINQQRNGNVNCININWVPVF